LGIGIDFVDDDSVVYPMDPFTMSPHVWEKHTLICTDYQYYVLQKAKEFRDLIMEDNGYMQMTDLEDMIDDHLRFYHHIDEDEHVREILGDFLDDYVL